jgi:hypothetical protein
MSAIGGRAIGTPLVDAILPRQGLFRLKRASGMRWAIRV